MRSTPPAHLALGPAGHGVRVLSEQLAAAVGATSVGSWAEAERHDHVHVHLNDRLLRESTSDPGGRLTRLARRSRVTITLHDVPQATDGEPFGRRREAYQHALAVADDWAVSSWHEHALVHEHLAPTTAGTVIPLPVQPAAARREVSPEVPLAWPTGPVVAVAGFVYPGKGHHELIRAAAAIRDHVEVTVLALGAVTPGHDALADELTATARSLGVPLAVTGHLDEATRGAALRRVDVPVCGHRNVSASGSINDWLAAGRRPLVRNGRYAREMETLRPGCHRLYDDGGLSHCLTSALRRPELTWLPTGTDTRPHLGDTAREHVAWWRSR